MFKKNELDTYCGKAGGSVKSNFWIPILLSPLFFLTACTKSTPIIVNSTNDPINSAYTHYTPSPTSFIRLEFDYPSYWFFSSEEKDAFLSSYSIYLIDPIFQTVPTRVPNEPHGTPSDFGSVEIRVAQANNKLSLNGLIDSYVEGHSGATWIEELNKYHVVIDGYDASVLEYQIEPIDFNGYSSSMFERLVFFEIDEQIYQITFIVAERERKGQFEEGFNNFFSSLKYVPITAK